jgi:hypothetical protein
LGYIQAGKASLRIEGGTMEAEQMRCILERSYKRDL